MKSSFGFQLIMLKGSGTWSDMLKKLSIFFSLKALSAEAYYTINEILLSTDKLSNTLMALFTCNNDVF